MRRWWRAATTGGDAGGESWLRPFASGPSTQVCALAVVAIAVLGVVLTFAVSWALSRTVLKGEVSTFSLELPSYSPSAYLADHLYIAHRPHYIRSLARNSVGGTRWCAHLAQF